MVDSAAVPVHKLPDGSQFITMQDAVEFPEVRAFIDRFPEYWVLDPLRDGWIGPAM